MAEVFLSEAWIGALADKGADLPKVGGVDLVVQHEISGAPEGKVRFFVEWRDGQIVEAAIGKHGDPHITVQAKAAEALKILRGETNPDVAYMQGRLKVDGSYRRLLIDLREWRASEPYRAMWAEMAELTLP